jgi:hypothetical protein
MKIVMGFKRSKKIIICCDAKKDIKDVLRHIGHNPRKGC